MEVGGEGRFVQNLHIPGHADLNSFLEIPWFDGPDRQKILILNRSLVSDRIEIRYSHEL
jgi:hypothetical protein